MKSFISPATLVVFNVLLGLARGVDYFVIPESFTDLEKNKAIQAKLEQISDNVKYSGLQDDVVGIDWWYLTLTNDEVDTVKAMDGVLVVTCAACDDSSCAVPGFCADYVEDEAPPVPAPSLDSFIPGKAASARRRRRRLAKRDLNPIENPEKVPELAYISLPPDHSLQETGNRYLYDESAGEKVTVYIVEGAAKTASYDEFADLVSQNRLSFGGPYYARQTGNLTWPAPDSTWFGSNLGEANHGTAVLSRVAGKKYGVAKKINVVVAQYSRDTPAASVSHRTLYENFISMLSWILDDWIKRRDTSASEVGVVNISYGFSVAPNSMIILRKLLALKLRALSAEGLILINSGGNNDTRTNRDTCKREPRYLNAPGNDPQWNLNVPNLLIAGGLNNAGSDIWATTNTPGSCDASFYNIWAPAEDVNLVDASGSESKWSGTSFSAPAVAGVAAYFAGFSDTYGDWNSGTPKEKVDKLTAYIKEKAYVRQNAKATSPKGSSMVGVYNFMPWNLFIACNETSAGKGCPAPTTEDPPKPTPTPAEKQCRLRVWTHLLVDGNCSPFGGTCQFDATTEIRGEIHGPGGRTLDGEGDDYANPADGIKWSGSGVEVEVVPPSPDDSTEDRYLRYDDGALWLKSGSHLWNTYQEDDSEPAYCKFVDYNTETQVDRRDCWFPCTCTDC